VLARVSCFYLPVLSLYSLHHSPQDGVWSDPYEWFAQIVVSAGLGMGRLLGPVEGLIRAGDADVVGGD
jgi:hypothetical protein